MQTIIAQDSPAWLPARVGHVTASHMNDVLDRRKDGKPGAGYSRYMMELVLERATGRATERPVTYWMTRGKEFEPAAQEAYSEHTGRLVSAAAFVTHPSIEHSGASPDGFIVGEPGLVEFKVPAPTTFATWRIAGIVPPEHEAQMLWQCACTGRKWVDFCAFNPEDPHPTRRLFIRRFTPLAESIEAAEAAVIKFLEQLDAAFVAYCADDQPTIEPANQSAS